MLLHFKNVTIDDDIFGSYSYARDLDLIAFTFDQGYGSEDSVNLNLVFNNPQDARRVYFTMLHTEADELDFRDIEVEWPSSLVDRIMSVLYEPNLFIESSES